MAESSLNTVPIAVSRHPPLPAFADASCTMLMDILLCCVVKAYEKFVDVGERGREGVVARCLTTETVKGAALSLEGVDDVEGCDGLALGVLGVGDGVADDTLEEGLENTAGLLVDHCEDASDVWVTRQNRRSAYWLRYA